MTLSAERVNYLTMTSTFLDIVLRSAIVYAVILVGLRLGGKRHIAQLSVVDLVLILLISNAVQNAMVGNDSSLFGGIVAAVTLFAVNYGFSFLLYRSVRLPLRYYLSNHTGELSEYSAQLTSESLAVFRHFGNEIPKRAATV